MLDGRLVTVDFTDIKSLKKVKKKDWIVIRVMLREQLKFVQSPFYTIAFHESLKKIGWM
jgi:hypothetical protein